MKKIILALLLVFSSISCQEDFLEEVNYNLNSEVFETEEGLEALLNNGYKRFRSFYGGDQWISAWVLTGTDVLFRGRNGQLNSFHKYQGIEATYDRVNNVWRLFYKGLNETNIFLSKVDEIYENEDLKNQRKAEALFQRAHWLWQITTHFGDAHLTTIPSTGPEFEAIRTPSAQFYEQIINDLLEAIALAPAEKPETGRAGKVAAQAFLARMYLYNKEYANASKMADEVIMNPNYKLEDNYADMWNTKENSEKNSEFILSAVFTSDKTNTQPSYKQHAWSSQFLNLLKHEGPIQDYYGAGFNRMATTRYIVTLYDEEIDQRGEVMFGSEPLEMKYEGTNNIASVFLRHEITPEELAFYEEKRQLQGEGQKKSLVNILDINAIFNPAGKLKEIGTFYDCRKVWNLTRKQLNTGNEGVFNHPIIRIAEMYLIKSEAEMMLGNLEVAVNTINILRRARGVQGKKTQMDITQADLDIDFILDERARELTHEQQRKFDLLRTGKFFERVQRYNPEATGLDTNRHSLLPIPQAQLDAMTPESAAAFGQNPGY